MTVSEYLVKFLEEHDIDRAYAVIGSTAMWLFRALGNSKKIRTVCTNHEQAAVMAADGWATLTGKPGAVFLTNGPGVTNAISGVAQAWTDSVSLVIISGESNCVSLNHEANCRVRQYGPQSVRTGELVGSIVKDYQLISRPEDVRSAIEKAYYVAVEGRPGPVWLSVPIDVQNAQVPEAMEGWQPPAPKPADGADAAVRVKTALLSARRPLILAGQGVRQSRSMEVFRRLIERYQIPVVTSRMGNDVIESDHPLFVGRPGNWGSRPAHFALQTADVLLVLGSHLALNTVGHTPSNFAAQAKKYIVDIDPDEFEKPGIAFEECIQEDLNRFLTELERADVPDPMGQARQEWCRRCRDWREKYPVMTPEYATRMPMSTYHFIDRLSSLAGDHDVILSDTGSCCNIVSQVWNVKPGQRLRVSGGLSCMGYWVTAMGMAEAHTEGNVICVAGDGSLQMNIQELGTIAHYGMPVKLMVINNNGYQIIRISQQAYMKGKLFAVSPETGVGLANTQRIAQAYGIAYRRVERPDEVDDAIRWALDHEGAAILEVCVAEDQIMLPRLTSKVQPDGTLKSAAYEDLAPFLSEEELRENLGR